MQLHHNFNLVGVKHQNVRNALEMAFAYDDILRGIYPQLVMHLYYHKPVYEQSKVVLQNVQADKKLASKHKVPLDQLNEVYKNVVNAKSQNTTAKDLYHNLLESIKKIER